MIYATIALQINQTLIVDIIDKPTDFIRMGFYYNFEGRVRVDNANRRSIRICKMRVNKGFNIIEP